MMNEASAKELVGIHGIFLYPHGIQSADACSNGYKAL